MELNGALSNPRATPEGCLAGLYGLVQGIRARPEAQPRERQPRARPVPVRVLVEAFVRSARGPVRVRDVCARLEAQGLGSFDRASVRKSLHDGSQGECPRFQRTGWGLYEARGAGDHSTGSLMR